MDFLRNKYNEQVNELSHGKNYCIFIQYLETTMLELEGLLKIH